MLSMFFKYRGIEKYYQHDRFFFSKTVVPAGKSDEFILTNKNFMWLIANNQLQTAIKEFRKARSKYRADSHFSAILQCGDTGGYVNANAYSLLRNHRQQEALEVFKLAVESYPESPNAYESLSEAFETNDNKQEAIRNAELCLQKLPAARDINESFRQLIKRSAEERIARLANEK